MAPSRTLLIFDLDDARFGLDATLVRESVWLPELTPVEEAPPYIAGIFSLRGQIVPVTDLNLRFGHPALPYRFGDQIVVLELDQLLMGLIVSEVREVIELSAEAIQPPPEFDGEAHRHAHLVAGEARVGDDIVTLLDVSQLMHGSQAPLPSPPPQAEEGATPSLARSAGEGWGGGMHFCPEATPEQRAIFHARARALMEAATEEEGTRLPLAVVELDGEYFGIGLEAVQEFCDIARPTPSPCCPPHILGAIGLRGNLFTLLDLRAALNLPRAAQRSGKAVIARASTRFGTGLGEQAVGVAVDQVHDVIYLREEELQATPSALREQHGAEVKGAAPYGGKMMAVLNLPALLAREEWIVNETV
ncbi:MAG: purine-binding chemotaxis protein CheW [Hydrogenophilales bacterium]|nr:purine-binding chemotaxis protein CheW [Hydrogenophilales bacterium]